jgi:hypothetical protein
VKKRPTARPTTEDILSSLFEALAEEHDIRTGHRDHDRFGTDGGCMTCLHLNSVQEALSDLYYLNLEEPSK